MSDDPKDDDVVGYGKPPRHSQFKKGQSGNPRGRPKGAKNAATILNEALNERVTVTEGGKRKAITKRKAAFKQLVNRAVSGDPRHMRMLLEKIEAAEARLDPATAQTESLGEADQAVLRELRARLGRIKSGGGDGSSDAN